jgi:hypothetical protein
MEEGRTTSGRSSSREKRTEKQRYESDSDSSDDSSSSTYDLKSKNVANEVYDRALAISNDVTLAMESDSVTRKGCMAHGQGCVIPEDVLTTFLVIGLDPVRLGGMAYAIVEPANAVLRYVMPAEKLNVGQASGSIRTPSSSGRSASRRAAEWRLLDFRFFSCCLVAVKERIESAIRAHGWHALLSDIARWAENCDKFETAIAEALRVSAISQSTTSQDLAGVLITGYDRSRSTCSSSVNGGTRPSVMVPYYGELYDIITKVKHYSDRVTADHAEVELMGTKYAQLSLSHFAGVYAVCLVVKRANLAINK